MLIDKITSFSKNFYSKALAKTMLLDWMSDCSLLTFILIAGRKCFIKGSKIML